MTTSNVTPAKTFFAIVMGDAIKAAANIESSFYKVAINLAGLNASKQVELIIGGGAIDEKRVANTWAVFLQQHAKAGNMVWSGTETAIDAIKLARGDAKTGLIREYIMKKAKGSRLVPGLERAKRVVTELVKDMLTNHGATIHGLAQMEKDGLGGDAIAERFAAFVKDTYPESFSGLVAYFAKAPKEGAKKTDYESAVERAEKLDLDSFGLFVAQMQARLSQLQHDAAEAQAMTEAVDDMETAEAAPVLIQAAA
jgi:hypothetical protein